MNCRRVRRLCSLAKDHALSVRQQTCLETHLAACPACRQEEQTYRELVFTLRMQGVDGPKDDLFARVLAHKGTEFAVPSQSWFAGMFVGRKPAMRWMCSGITAVVALTLFGVGLMETHPHSAYGQVVLQPMRAAVSHARTLHGVVWIFPASTPAEAQHNEWHEGKPAMKLEHWARENAIRNFNEIEGPVLWTANGYLAYDHSVNKVRWQPYGHMFAEVRQATLDPLAMLKTPPLPGVYRSAKRLGEVKRRGRLVYILQIMSGPEKPKPAQEIDSAPSAAPSSHSTTTPLLGMAGSLARREQWTFWVDRTTHLPVGSEHQMQVPRVYSSVGKPLGRQWVLLDRAEYEFQQPLPDDLFDVNQVQQAATAYFARRNKTH